MEYIKDAKIKVYIDTNKSTYEKNFGDVDEAEAYLNSLENTLVDEIVRESKIKVYIDTNKATYDEDFTDVGDAGDYMESITERISGEQGGVEKTPMIERISESPQIKSVMGGRVSMGRNIAMPSASELLE
jgi:rhamnose utilization protein RhaD (predicted bifunctional aldolase and dehydrogenase)